MFFERRVCRVEQYEIFSLDEAVEEVRRWLEEQGFKDEYAGLKVPTVASASNGVESKTQASSGASADSASGAGARK